MQVVGTGLTDRRDDAVVPRLRCLRVALAQPARVGLDMQVPTGLDVDDAEHADRRKGELARIGDVRGDDTVAQGKPAQAGEPVGAVEKVGRDDDLSAMVLGAVCPAERGGEVGRRIRTSVATWGVVDARERGEHAGPTLSRWQVLELVAAGDQYAEPVAAAACHHSEGGQCCQYDLALLPPGRTEV